MARTFRTLVSTIALVFVSACGSTHSVALSPAPKLAPGQHVSVWRGTTATQLTRAQGERDTIQGTLAVNCDSCRTSIPPTEVDSLTVRSGNEWAWAVPLGVAAAVMIVWRATDSD